MASELYTAKSFISGRHCCRERENGSYLATLRIRVLTVADTYYHSQQQQQHRANQSAGRTGQRHICRNKVAACVSLASASAKKKEIIISAPRVRSQTPPTWEISKVQQNGGVLECERANQIAEFKFSDITTRNDHVTA